MQLSDRQLYAFQNSDARINVFEGPVGSGKSFTTFVRFLEEIRSGPKGPGIICGKTDKTIKRNVILPLQDLVGKDLRYYSGKGEAYLYDRVLYIVGANDDRAEGKIRGSEFALALVDEGTLMPETFFKMLLSRMRIEHSKIFIGTNPDSPYHWLKTDFIDRQHELNLKVFSYNITDNPSLSPQIIKDLSAEYQGLWHKRYIQGLWVSADGAVYDFFDEDINVIKMPKDPAIYYIVGIDAGCTNPQAMSLIGYNPSSYPNIWKEKEYYYDSAKHQRQKSDFEYVNDYKEWAAGYNVKLIYIDPSAASLRQEFYRQGITNIADAKNDVIPGIRFQSMLLTNGTYKICSCCTETIKEYKNYVWDSKAALKGEDKPLKKFDHCLDSERYALFTHFFEMNLKEIFTEADAEALERMYT